uniref:FTH domain-containing protein n=1 Tax=Panagrellus redivivus TaxID=6233 RepID=A0A7E4UYQ1_PANRE
MSDPSSSVAVNLPILQDIYRDILAKSAPHNSLQNVCPLAFSGRNSLNAFWQVVSDVPEATIVRANPSRIDLDLYKKGTLSVCHTQGSFGQRILDRSARSIKKLTVENAPIWARNWLKEFVNHDRLKELIIDRQVESGSFTILAQIARSIKKLTDKTGKVVPKLKGGDFDYVAIKMTNFSWPENLLSSNMKFTTKYFHCVVDEPGVTHTLVTLQREFSKVSSEKLAAVKTFHIFFNFFRAQRNFQPFVDTIAEKMPNVETIVLSLETIEPGLDRAYKFLPHNIGKTYEAIQNLVPPLGVTVKTKVISNTKTYVYNDDLELPNRIVTVLGCMRRVPLNENVKVATSTRALENERNRYQQWEFDAGNEMGPHKEFSCDITIYAEKF